MALVAVSSEAALVVRDPTPLEEADLVNPNLTAHAQIGDSPGPSSPGDPSRELLISAFGGATSSADFQVIDGTAHPYSLSSTNAGATTLTYGNVSTSPVTPITFGNALKITVFSAWPGVTEEAQLTFENGNGDVYVLPLMSATNGSMTKIVTGIDFTGSTLSGTLTSTGALVSPFGARGQDARLTVSNFITVPEPSMIGIFGLSMIAMARRGRR